MRTAANLVVALATLVGAAAVAPGQAQSPISVKIGVLTDMSSLYAEDTGPGSVAAAELAIQDFDPAAHNMKVDLVSADHQNKPDIGGSIARQWYGANGVNMIIDVPNSAVALEVSDVTRQMNGVFLVSGAATSDLTGPRCSPNTIHWTYDTWMLAHGTGKSIVQTGGKTWFFITADYAFGHALERDTTAVVEASGGQVLGHVLVPLNTQDFSSFLLQAQASKAQIIGLANAGGDTINSIKQGAEFGITKGGQHFAGLLVFIPDVQALGLQAAQGLILTEPFYWDMDAGTRAWTKRWQVKRPGRFPSEIQAGVYSATLHYLKAVAALKSAVDGKAVVAKMKAIPTDDPLFGKGYVRADGRTIHPAYLFQVKSPAESKYPGDDYILKATIPADQAFRPMSQDNCPLVNAAK